MTPKIFPSSDHKRTVHTPPINNPHYSFHQRSLRWSMFSPVSLHVCMFACLHVCMLPASVKKLYKDLDEIWCMIWDPKINWLTFGCDQDLDSGSIFKPGHLSKGDRWLFMKLFVCLYVCVCVYVLDHGINTYVLVKMLVWFGSWIWIRTRLI